MGSHPLLSLVPWDLVELIVHHMHALTLQRGWRRYAYLSHARHPLWARILQPHLECLGAWPSLREYALVRREWRMEPESWCLVDEVDVAIIRLEARHGVWGSRKKTAANRLPAPPAVETKSRATPPGWRTPVPPGPTSAPPTPNRT